MLAHGGPVDKGIASEQAYSVSYRSAGRQPSPRDQTERSVPFRLRRKASLAVLTLLSVGLWAAIWVAANWLVAVWLR
jgi:hypothetical protein